MKKALWLVALLLVVLPGYAQYTGESGYPDNLLVKALDNGLEVVIEENHANPIVRVHAYMRIGSLFEGEYLGCGLSHYMEHIVSGGSTRRKVKAADGTEQWAGRTEAESQRLLKSIGDDTNASTFYNATEYYITTKSEMVETALDLISDWLQHCQFDEVEVAREQRVIQQELLGKLDNPNRARSQTFSATMFKVHPARVPIIGYQDCIQGLTRDDMLRFYQKHYTPQNCVVAIVGDVEKHRILDLVKKYFGGWKRKPLEPYQLPQEPAQLSMRWVEKEHGSTKTCLVAMGVPTIDLRHPDLYKLDMLSNVLGISASARLPKKFEHDPRREVVATELGTSSWTPSFGAGRFGVYFSADTLENARKLVREIWEEMGKLKTELVTAGEIQRSLKVLEKYYYRGRETVDDRADSLASNLAWLDDPLFTDTYLENIQAVTPEQIREAALTYLVPEKFNVVIITPPVEEADVVETQQEETTGQVKKIVLENGLVLLLKRLPGHGMVDVSAAFNGGVIYEDGKTNGLFFLMGHTFWRGTESRPFPELISQMDALGLELSAESHNNVYFVQMRCLASEFGPSMELFSDVLLNPAIEEQWVERIKQILLMRVLPNLEVQAEELCSKVLRTRLYTKSPYRRQRYGTPETVASFTAEQVHELYETFSHPNNCVLALYGELDPTEAEAVVRKLLGGWEKGELPKSLVVEEPALAEPITVELTNQQVRTNYRIAWHAFSRQQEEEKWAMSVMNSIIGASGWLHARLREGSSDYVYSVYGRPYTGDLAGHYFIDTDFEPADEETVLSIIDGVVEDIKAGRFTDEELALAKRMILCYDALGKKENNSVCRGDSLSELLGQGWDYDVRYYAGIKAVTREDVVRVANGIFSCPALRILVRPENNEEPE